MRRSILLAAVLLVSACSSNGPVLPEASLPADYYAGTLRMYPFREIDPVKPPKGYEPFMISHYGRHGARFHGDDTQGEKVYEALCAGPLTEQGKELRDFIGLYYDRFAGHVSDLTEKGRLEQRELAHRMWKAYPSLFKRDPEITAVSTSAPRCILSMGAFCDGMKDKKPSLWIKQSSSKSYDNFLQPQKLIPGFTDKEKDAWRIAREFCADTIDPRAFIERIFGDPDYRVESYPSNVSFMRNVHYLLCQAPAMDLTLPPAPEVFTPEERSKVWEGDNLKYYLNYGYYRDSVGVNAASAIMADILHKAKDDIESGKQTVRLRFGHDANLMSLLAYMGVPEFTGATSDLHMVKDLWQEWRIPFAANLQLVFYRNSADDVLILPLLNEEPVKLPLEPVENIFYSWEDFEKRYAPLP